MGGVTILVNYVTWPAVGHAVEGLRAAFGYRQANPRCEVDLVLSSHTAVGLAAVSPWLRATHTVDIPSPVSPVGPDVFGHIPREWDYVVFDGKGQPNSYGLYRAQAARYFRARIASGFIGSGKVPYDRDARLRFVLPEEALALARTLVPDDGVQIALLPAGGSRRRHLYPSAGSWLRILDAVRRRYPNAAFHLLGKLEEGDHPNTSAIARAEVEQLVRDGGCNDYFDIGLVNQLAVAQRCDLFLSPHSGFAFAVLAVGTPWLTISGGRYLEFFHVGTPFYSVLPDPSRYPAFDPETYERTVTDTDGSERILSMCARRIAEDLDEIVYAAELLVERRWTFEQCREHYLRRRARLYDPAWRRWAVLGEGPLTRRLRTTSRTGR